MARKTVKTNLIAMRFTPVPYQLEDPQHPALASGGKEKRLMKTRPPKILKILENEGIENPLGLIIDTYAKTRSLNRCEEILGVSRPALRNVLLNAGIKARRRQYRNTTLRPGEVWLIRKCASEGVPDKTIRQMFCLPQTTLYLIRTGRTFKI
jgi:hypothetical protein